MLAAPCFSLEVCPPGNDSWPALHYDSRLCSRLHPRTARPHTKRANMALCSSCFTSITTSWPGALRRLKPRFNTSDSYRTWHRSQACRCRRHDGGFPLFLHWAALSSCEITVLSIQSGKKIETNNSICLNMQNALTRVLASMLYTDQVRSHTIVVIGKRLRMSKITKAEMEIASLPGQRNG